jgi:PAS domain S-box-containing protein
MMDELLVVMDMDGYVLYANKAVADYLGFLETDLSEMHYLELHPDSEWDRVDSVLSKAKVGKTIVFETLMVSAEGPLHKVESRIVCGEWSDQPCVIATSRFLD